MRSPKFKKVKAKSKQSKINSLTNLEFKTYNSGGTISLPNKETSIQLIEACDLRYFHHLAISEAHKNSVLVLWENEKGEAPIRDSNGEFVYSEIQQLKLEIHHNEGGNKFRKLLGITFHLKGQKNAVVVSSHAAHQWIDFEYPVLKCLIKLKEKGLTRSKLIEKSQKEEFIAQITSNPQKKGKLITIHFEDDASTDDSPPTNTDKKESDENLMAASLYDSGDRMSTGNSESDDSADSDCAIEDSFFLSSPKISSLHYKKVLTDVKKLGKENAILKQERVDLRFKIDQLTAKLLDQEQKIEYLFNKLGYPQLQSSAKQNPASNTHILKEKAPIPGKKPKIEISTGQHAPPQHATIRGAANVDEKNNLQGSTKAATESPVPDNTRRPWSNICKNYNRGICHRSDCRYIHKVVTTCRFYNNPSGCKKGQECNFLHVKKPSGGNGPTRDPQIQRADSDTRQLESMKNNIHSFLENALESKLTKVLQPVINATPHQFVQSIPSYPVMPFTNHTPQEQVYQFPAPQPIYEPIRQETNRQGLYPMPQH